MNLEIPTREIVAAAEKVLGCKVEITHLVTVGCSWTYCQGLPDKLNQGWPALVARKLNIPLVNLAVPGSGNDAIHRKTYEYVYENLPTGSNPVFIIAWSQYWRREVWKKKTKDSDYENLIMPDNLKNMDIQQNAALDNFDDLNHGRKTYMFKLSLMNLFKSHNIPYLMTDFSDGYSSAGIIDPIVDKTAIEYKIKESFPNLYNTVNNNPYYMEPFYVLAEPYPKTPNCNHIGIEGNKFLAEYTVEKMLDTFPNASYINNRPYLKLQHFIKTQPFMMKRPEWCFFVL